MNKEEFRKLQQYVLLKVTGNWMHQQSIVSLKAYKRCTEIEILETCA